MLSNETLRFNMDPTGMVEDDVIMEALQKTYLREHFTQGGTTSPAVEPDAESTVEPVYHDHSILDQKLSSFSELSVGESQLFALCRALVKVHLLRDQGIRPIILLDEVTSSLDLNTEAAMHNIIDHEFTQKGHTVIVIAHRLGVLSQHARPGQDVVVRLREGRFEDVGTDLTGTAKEER